MRGMRTRSEGRDRLFAQPRYYIQRAIMKTIYKYRLEKTGSNLIKMPMGAAPLHVGMQSGKTYIWMMVDNDQPIETRQLWLEGTGWDMTEMPQSASYLGTAQTDESLVWHVFDCGHAPNGDSRDQV